METRLTVTSPGLEDALSHPVMPNGISGTVRLGIALKRPWVARETLESEAKRHEDPHVRTVCAGALEEFLIAAKALNIEVA